MDNTQLALGAAVAAIYFDDSADYAAALWQIIGLLGGEEAQRMLEEDEHEAYKKYAEKRNKELGGG